MKRFIQSLLGIDVLLAHLYDIRNNRLDDRRLLNEIEQRIAALEPGIGRVIAKIDPLYGVPEDDPKRRAESDVLGAQVIRRLQGEETARRQHPR